jgi:hypothetical protein
MFISSAFMAISLAIPRVFTRLVQQYWMPTDVYRRQAPMRTAGAELTCAVRRQKAAAPYKAMH